MREPWYTLWCLFWGVAIGYIIGGRDTRRLRALLKHERKRQSAMHDELKNHNGCQWFD